MLTQTKINSILFHDENSLYVNQQMINVYLQEALISFWTIAADL